MTEVISVVNASSSSQLHPAAVLDDVSETEFVGAGLVKEEGEEGRFTGDGRPSPGGREGRGRLVGGREEGAVREMVVD